jgi:hypothetical protein
MPCCRWFTRGWCLQELIAPRDVSFYNNSWQRIGEKSTARLKGLISRITNIDQAVLSDAELLPTLSVAQRMSWASQRVTTRPEDIAYCLLGIFEINMPMLYGEGEKAFLRLQEEIIKRSNDLSIFAWGPSALDYDDTNSLPTDPDSRCDLFAESPRDFSACGNIVLPYSGAFRNVEFSITNNGLFLSQVDLQLNFNKCFYLLPLRCYNQSPPRALYLALKMVHTRLFVKLGQCETSELFMANEKVDGYVLTHVTTPARNQVRLSYIKSVQLWSPLSSKFELYSSLLEISSRDIWDASKLTFLSCDDQPLKGYCKLSGRSLARALPDYDSPERHFYLAWGGLFLSDGATNSYREAVWVRLYSLEDWGGPHYTRDPIYANPSQASRYETHRLRLASQDVKVGVASIEEHGRIFFRINIEVSFR